MSYFQVEDLIPLIESYVLTYKTFIYGGAETTIMADVIS